MQPMACIPVHMLALSHAQDHTSLQTRLHQLMHKTAAAHVHISLATLQIQFIADMAHYACPDACKAHVLHAQKPAPSSAITQCTCKYVHTTHM